MKHLTGLGKNWDDFVDPAMLAYNTYCTPNLDNLCPFQLPLGKNPKIIPEIEIEPAKPFVGTFKEAFENLKQKLQYFSQRLIEFRNNRLGCLNKNKELHGYTVGQLVYLYNPRGALLQTGSRKIKCEWVGPLVIHKCVSPQQFLLMSLDGKVYPMLVEETRLKPGKIWTTVGNVKHLSELLMAIRSGFKDKSCDLPIMPN